MIKPGVIALDIDGTLTWGYQLISPKVAACLNELVLQGWQLVFITGRTYKGSYPLLKSLSFPYYLAVQNGASILQLPEGKIIAKKYLDRSIFEKMEIICQHAPTDFAIYGGIEHRDECYYRPKQYSSTLLNYLQARIEAYKEVWHPLESYDQMPLEEFASIKCFGNYTSALQLTQRIEAELGLHVPLIRDPFNQEYYVVQATHPKINKGQALKDVIAAFGGLCGPIIVAGDDFNDLPMLDVADVKIVMNTAPQELLQIAHVIAPSAEIEGIIVGLEAAIKGKFK